MLAHHPLITASDRLYFAYGSNLSPGQMAHRCPDSIFLGKATLPGHRWQVNERGVANVVPVPRGDSKKGRRDEAVVEGLLYAVSAADERRLDRYEGIAKGWYERFEVQVDFEPVRGNVFARCTSASVAKAVKDEREGGMEEGAPSVVVGVERRARSWDDGEGEDHQRRRRDHRPRDRGRRGASVGSSSSASSSSAAIGSGFRNSILGLLGLPNKTERVPSPSPAREDRGRERAVESKPVVALVYASTVHVHDGNIRARYVPRMERAMADAVALGVSKAFVEKHMVPQVWGVKDGPEKGRREVDSVKRRSVSQSDGLGRRGRRDSIVVDRHRDY